MPVPRKLSGLTLVLVGLCAFSTAALAQDLVPGLDAAVTEGATQLMQTYGVPGLSIAVSVNGKQHFYNFGVASRDTRVRISSDTLFEVGSISKTLTATLATYAQINGQLSLDAPVSRYVPELQGTAFGKVQLTHLATHTAGGFPLQVPDAVQNEQQLMDYLKAWKPVYPAGTQRSYANPSIGMLGLITARSMNQPFAQAMENTLFPALGLHSTYIDVPKSKMALYAQGYDKQDQPVRLNSGMLGNEAYGVKTSSRDLIHFAQLNALPGKPSTKIQQAIGDTHTGYFRIGPMTQDLIWEQYAYPVTLKNLLLGNSDKMAYENNDAIALHPPLAPQEAVWINKTGSTGGFGGYVALIPVKKQAVVILANKNYPNSARIELAYKILNALD